MKKCNKCSTERPIEEFDLIRNSKGERVPGTRCKDCRRAYMRKRARGSGKTGLTKEQYLETVRKPKLSPEERIELGKAKWEAWHAEYKLKLEKERTERLAAESKVCSNCQEELPISMFGKKTRTNKDYSYVGLQARCRNCRKVSAKAYRKENPDVARAYSHTPKGKEFRRRSHALRNRRSKQATPKWLTPEQKQQIVAIYEHMRDCRAVTGEEYHVDHIVPLRGKNVCGLHVPWNLQVLPACVNMSKSNNL